jgi:hypothetical protein
VLLEELVEEEKIRTLTNQMPCSEETVANRSRSEKKSGIVMKCVIDCDHFKKLQEKEKFFTYVTLPLLLLALLQSLVLLYMYFLGDKIFCNIAADN